jgi:YidC/Oxa1 family membrane protein insertase
LPSAQNSSTTIENKLVKLTIANKGIYCWSYFEKIFKGLKGSGELVKL